MGQGSHGWPRRGRAGRSGRTTSALFSISALLLALSAVALAGSASAHAAGSAHPDDWNRLMWIVLAMAIMVAILVYGVMAVALWRFREGSPYVRKEPSTDNARLETAWTIFPAVLVTIIVILSLQVMQTTEETPDEGVHIQVIGKQFEWLFIYPDNTTSVNELWVEEGQTVIFEIWSADVIHSFWLPDFKLKVDAFPNYHDDAFIIATPAGDYPIECAEFCGDIHSEMLGTLHIFKKGLSDTPWGPPPGEVPPPPEVERVTLDVELREDGGPNASVPWSVSPSLIEINESAEVTLRVWNNGTQLHSFFLAHPYGRTVSDIPPGEFRYLNFTADFPTRGLQAYCPDDAHRGQGMNATIVVDPKLVEGGVGTEQPVVSVGALYGLSLGVLALVMFVAVREPKARDEEEDGSDGKEEQKGSTPPEDKAGDLSEEKGPGKEREAQGSDGMKEGKEPDGKDEGEVEAP